MVFLFADTQIADENIMKDMNFGINAAYISNFYADDEEAEILERIQTVAR